MKGFCLGSFVLLGIRMHKLFVLYAKNHCRRLVVLLSRYPDIVATSYVCMM